MNKECGYKRVHMFTCIYRNCTRKKETYCGEEKLKGEKNCRETINQIYSVALLRSVKRALSVRKRNILSADSSSARDT